MSVLLVDGDNLLTIGYHALKNYFYKGKHIGGLYHFLNTLRRLFDEHNVDKICVFWDGEDSSGERKKIYHLYKENRRSRLKSEEEKESYLYQRNRVKQYLEELYVRQGEYEKCESDDCIAYYTQNSKESKKIIFSSDRDLAQLVKKDVSLYNPSHRKMYGPGDIIEYDHESILIENVKLVKILCGDPSDNINGIRNLGIKRLIGLIPEIKNKPLTLQDALDRGNLLFEQDKHNTTIKNFLGGVTKEGTFGEEFFIINNQIVNLDEPILTEEAKESIMMLITENLDSEGRSYKNCMKMMMEDGLFTVLPKGDTAWLDFLRPYLRLTSIEKNKKKIIKFKI